MGIVHQTLAVRGRTIDAQPRDVTPVRVTARVASPVTPKDETQAAVTSRLTELEARVTALEALVVSQRHTHAERQRRYRERKRAHGLDSQR